MCVPDGSAVTTALTAQYPDATVVSCADVAACIAALKDGSCDVYGEDQLLLRFEALNDEGLVVTGDGFDSQFIGPVIVRGLPEEYYAYLNSWMYQALADGSLDELSVKYFGSAGAGQSCPECPSCNGSNGGKQGSGVPVMNAVFSAVGPAVGILLA